MGSSFEADGARAVKPPRKRKMKALKKVGASDLPKSIASQAPQFKTFNLSLYIGSSLLLFWE